MSIQKHITSNCRVNNSLITKKHITAICERGCDPVFHPTDSITVPSTATFSAISPDGSEVFILLSSFLGNVVVTPLAATLFRNTNGKLTPILDVPIPTDFPILSTAAVSTDFTLFGLVFEREVGGNGIINIYTRDNLHNPVLTIPIVPGNFQPFTTNTSFLGGFSEDNRFFAITFTTGDNNKGNLQVYDVNTGSLVASTTTVGFSSGAYFFDLCQKSHKKCKHSKSNRRTFIATTPAATQYPVSPPEGCTINNSQPSVLDIFELVENSLVLVAEIQLNQFIRDISIPRGACCPSEILISVITGGIVPGQPTLPVFINPDGVSFNDELGGLRIFRFNGETLCLAAFQPPIIGGLSACTFDSTGQFIALAFSANVRTPPTFQTTPPPSHACRSFSYPNFVQNYRVVNQPKKHKNHNNGNCDCSVCIYPLDIPRPGGAGVNTIPTSLNGRWQVVSGGTLSNVTATGAGTPVVITELPTGPINNIQLYEVIHPCDCNFNDEGKRKQICLCQNKCKNKKKDDDSDSDKCKCNKKENKRKGLK